ncbi:uncharacterized protein P884DRAFT_278259 [Thermothelomyces heterothallicus CBS 202.75]|uniref:uncharacterized protein n=1 Tax=Thermothelomyces heterothallicus CBS 202.75 TaxID=1149848 RepID=UPI003744A2F4
MSATDPVSKVAIVGASGRIGGAFARALLQGGKHTVTALTRKGSNGEIPEGAKKVEVDYDNQDSIVEALVGQEFLIITLGVSAPPELHSKITDAAGKAKVQYVMPNYYGYPHHTITDSTDIYTKLSLERLSDVTRNGFSTRVHMACGFWYEWSLALGDPWFGIDIAQRKVTFFDDGKRPITVSTWDQCGRAIAALLSLPQRGSSPSLADFVNDKGVLIESWHLSQRDMLDSVHRVLGTTDADWQITYEPVEKRLKDGEEQMRNKDRRGFAKVLYGGVFDASNPVSNYVGEANPILGLPKEDLDEATKRAVDMALSGYNPLGDLTMP